jgi:hypothetical protein
MTLALAVVSHAKSKAKAKRTKMIFFIGYFLLEDREITAETTAGVILLLGSLF